MAGMDIQVHFEIAFDAVKGSDDALAETAFSFSRLGVAAFDREANATNQALGISIGSPTGMPAIFGVSAKLCPGSSKPGAVQLMQA